MKSTLPPPSQRRDFECQGRASESSSWDGDITIDDDDLPFGVLRELSTLSLDQALEDASLIAILTQATRAGLGGAAGENVFLDAPIDDDAESPITLRKNTPFLPET